MTDENKIFTRKLISDILIYSEDTMRITRSYLDKTGLSLPLVPILDQLRFDQASMNDDLVVHKLDSARQDLASYLSWRIENAEKSPVFLFQSYFPAESGQTPPPHLIGIAEKLAGIGVTMWLLAKNDLYTHGSFIEENIQILFSELSVNSDRLNEKEHSATQKIREKITELKIQFDRKEAREILELAETFAFSFSSSGDT